MGFLMFPPSPQRLRRAGLPLHVSAISIRRDTACSFDDFSTKGGNCTAHGGRFFLNTKPLQTLIETRAGGLFVKYVFLTSTQKTGKKAAEIPPSQRGPPCLDHKRIYTSEGTRGLNATRLSRLCPSARGCHSGQPGGGEARPTLCAESSGSRTISHEQDAT
jgi:hypothetical protein